MRKRLNYIDWLKGIAIISVVMGHILLFVFYPSGGFGKSFTYRFIYSIHMPLFIFLSGLVVSYKFESIITTCKKLLIKARLLLTPLILVGILYALWNGYTIYAFTTSPLKIGYWYLLTLFELYVIYYVIYSFSFFSNSIIEDLIKGSLIWLIFKGLVYPHLDEDLMSIIQFNQLIIYWPFFLVAAMINKYQLQDKLFSNNNLFTVSLLVFGGLFIYKEYAPIDNLMMYPLQFAGIFCIIYLVYKVKDMKNSTLDRLNVIGRNSLDIYIFHYFYIHVGYMKVVGNYFLEYPNFIMETIVTLVYALIIVYCSIYTGKLLRGSKVISKVLFNK